MEGVISIIIQILTVNVVLSTHLSHYKIGIICEKVKHISKLSNIDTSTNQYSNKRTSKRRWNFGIERHFLAKGTRN